MPVSTVEEKIQLLHPEGKKMVKISAEKYDVLKSSIVRVLRKKKSCFHTELAKSVVADIKARKIRFEGSLEWYMESVKLDLEARKLVRRELVGARPQFSLGRKS